MQFILPVFADECPRYLKNRSHAHADSSSVKRVAAAVCHEHRFDIKRRRGTDYRSDIGGVHNVFEHGNSLSTGADFFRAQKRFPAHCAKKPPCKRKTCELLQHIKSRCKNRDIAAPGDYILRFAFDMFILNKNRNRFITGIKRPFDYFRAFGNEHSLFRKFPVKELHLRKPCINVKLRR